jgi:hypothetical protein
MDNLAIILANWDFNLEYLDAWKFSKVANFISISKLDDFSWMNSRRRIFELCEHDFRERSWFMSSFSEDVERGRSYTFDDLSNKLENIDQEKPSSEIIIDWIRYLFKFEPEKYAPVKDIIFNFFKINDLFEENNNDAFDWQNCMIKTLNRIPFCFVSKAITDDNDSSFLIFNGPKLFDEKKFSIKESFCRLKSVNQLFLSSKLRTRLLKCSSIIGSLEYCYLQHSSSLLPFIW